MKTLLDWRRAGAEGRAIWWRGSRPQLVVVAAGQRLISQQFDSEADALLALDLSTVKWTPIARNSVSGGAL